VSPTDPDIGTRLDRALRAPARSARPRGRQWPIAILLFALLFATMFGMVTAFFPAESWALLSPYVSLPIGLAVGVPVALKVSRGGAPEVSRGGRRHHAAATIVLLTILAGCWVLISLALPDVYTRAFGRPFRVEQPVKALRPGGRKCPTEVHAPMLELRVPRPYLCMSIEGAMRARAGGTAVFLGRESWFGRHVDRFEAAPGPGAGS
jgi:hypothetical protein